MSAFGRPLNVRKWRRGDEPDRWLMRPTHTEMDEPWRAPCHADSRREGLPAATIVTKPCDPLADEISTNSFSKLQVNRKLVAMTDGFTFTHGAREAAHFDDTARLARGRLRLRYGGADSRSADDYSAGAGPGFGANRLDARWRQQLPSRRTDRPAHRQWRLLDVRDGTPGRRRHAAARDPHPDLGSHDGGLRDRCAQPWCDADRC